jgi:hypothetical protein
MHKTIFSKTRGHEFPNRAPEFTGELSHRLITLRKLATSVPRVTCPECGNKMRLAFLEPHATPTTRKETTTFICGCGERFSYTVAPQL